MFSATAVNTQVHIDASAEWLQGMFLHGDNENELHLVYVVNKK